MNTHAIKRGVAALGLCALVAGCGNTVKVISGSGGDGGDGGVGAGGEGAGGEGAGGGLGCQVGDALCNAECVDLKIDFYNCGSCNNVCGSQETCLNGTCQGDPCPPGLTNCFGQCVDLAFDPSNCGACNNSCSGGDYCDVGSCACLNNNCGVCVWEDAGSQVPQTKTGSATKNELDPSCAAPGSPEVMYTFTAPNSGTYSFDTKGSNYDTALYLLNDATCGEIACNDDDNFGLESLVVVQLSAGQTVNVVVDGFGGDSGTYVLNINEINVNVPNCPTNDLGSLSPQTVSGDTTSAPSVHTGLCGGWGSELSYAFTAPATGDYLFHTDGSAIDTVLYVRDGSCNGPELACNDDAIGLSSLVFVTLQAGQNVVVFVDTFDNFFAGPFQLQVFGPL